MFRVLIFFSAFISVCVCFFFNCLHRILRQSSYSCQPYIILHSYKHTCIVSRALGPPMISLSYFVLLVENHVLLHNCCNVEANLNWKESSSLTLKLTALHDDNIPT